jgi:hypothetical protein
MSGNFSPNMGSNPKRLAITTGNIVLKTAIKFMIFLGMTKSGGWVGKEYM